MLEQTGLASGMAGGAAVDADLPRRLRLRLVTGKAATVPTTAGSRSTRRWPRPSVSSRRAPGQAAAMAAPSTERTSRSSRSCTTRSGGGLGRPRSGTSGRSSQRAWIRLSLWRRISAITAAPRPSCRPKRVTQVRGSAGGPTKAKRSTRSPSRTANVARPRRGMRDHAARWTGLRHDVCGARPIPPGARRPGLAMPGPVIAITAGHARRVGPRGAGCSARPPTRVRARRGPAPHDPRPPAVSGLDVQALTPAGRTARGLRGRGGVKKSASA